ncbi:unnamed protein product [Microthlaspi erraticum]|uniref:Uncharacterized protein n=1 Tax=Microthlaspi erraticum TaxID=1685480 RepID=A0A6D2KBL3_9BRAS|nr:unnamed protein product [Microthlaspi erraticum]
MVDGKGDAVTAIFGEVSAAEEKSGDPVGGLSAMAFWNPVEYEALGEEREDKRVLRLVEKTGFLAEALKLVRKEKRKRKIKEVQEDMVRLP